MHNSEHLAKEKLGGGNGPFGLVFRCWGVMISLARRLYAGVVGQLGGFMGGELVEVGGLAVRVGKRVAGESCASLRICACVH
jgi:hypothetical protein